jgi:hypothetical protein
MNELFQQWLDARYSVPGMIACGVATSDADSTCRSADVNFSPDQMGQIVRQLLNTAPAPGVEANTVCWHTWVFANGKIRSVTRPDGCIFVAAVRINSDAAQILDPLTEEFLALNPAG